ncbi:MAG TPA: ABC transporter ATP-binding protein [Actinobacteria bacterium]|nr:ABC transporter ATP-binding protein [Actinomycetota bacterium]
MIVTMEGVTKRYGATTALSGADLHVEEGSITGLIGPNGAGKTTALRIVATLLARDAGTVSVAGLDPERDPRGVRRILGWVPDFFGVYDRLEVAEYLEFFAAAHGVPPERRRGLVADLLALVDLEEKADTDVNVLSRGMKQRLSLARALVHDPELLVLDEPASGLDPRARVQLRELVAELARMGKTVLISSHILSELEGICSHLVIVDRGRVKAQGPVSEVLAAAAGTRLVVLRTTPEARDAAEEVVAGSELAEELVVERDRILITSRKEEIALARLVAELVDAGVPILEWRVESGGLEELFLALTEEAS